MGLTPPQEFVLDWMGGAMNPRSLRYVVLGAQNNVPAHFGRFVCLYPDRPVVRRFTVKLPDGIPDSALPRGREVDELIQRCVPIKDLEVHYRRCLRSTFPTIDPRMAMKDGVEQARRAGLPIGVYALGVTPVRRVHRAILVVNALVSPEQFLRELKRAL